MTQCGWCTGLRSCSSCAGGCAQTSGSIPSHCMCIESRRFCSKVQQEKCWDVRDYSIAEVLHWSNSSLLAPHLNLNKLSDISTNLGTKLPKILTPRPQHWDRQQMWSGRIWKRSTEFLHPVLGETAKTSTKRNLHSGMRLGFWGVSLVQWPNTGGAATAPCCYVPSESDQHEIATVENVHICIYPVWIPAAAGLRQCPSSCPWIPGLPSSWHWEIGAPEDGPWGCQLCSAVPGKSWSWVLCSLSLGYLGSIPVPLCLWRWANRNCKTTVAGERWPGSRRLLKNINNVDDLEELLDGKIRHGQEEKVKSCK